jgi:hypothetical protein
VEVVVKYVLQILSFFAWLWKRIATKRDNPQNQYEQAQRENQEIIATHDADAINRMYGVRQGSDVDHSGES